MAFDVEKIVIKGRCMYAMVNKPRPGLNGTLQTGITLEVDDKLIKELFDKGLSKQTKIRTFEDFPGVKFLNFKREITSKSGNTIPPVTVLGSDRKPFTKLIGNGSVVKAVIELLKYDHPQFGKGLRARLAAVQVLEHIPFEPEEQDVFKDLLSDEGKGAVDTTDKDVDEFTDKADPDGAIS